MQTTAAGRAATLWALDALRDKYPDQYAILVILTENPRAKQADIAQSLGCCQQNVSKLKRAAMRNLERLKDKARSQIGMTPEL